MTDLSTNERAERLMGRRSGGIPIDLPPELGYHCPVCVYPHMNETKTDWDERLLWSEYEGFLWCSVCNKDYPSALCCPGDIDKAIKTFLDTVERAVKNALR